jgi:D-alanyl-lipoteichoic acid acyltransferase DltB (MBOAT superfamily)
MAGPIERATNLLPQIYRKRVFNYSQTADGLRLILWGLFCKIVIADRIAIFINGTYGNIEQAQGLPLVFAVIFFAFQLYIDFSAYSNIAIGAGKILGFSLLKNFNRPYLSASFSEFWKRWHISLSTWFRDYLYISLGGNRKGKIRTYVNLMTVFLVSGLWHGASWNFVIWGAINGLFVIIFDNLFKLERRKGIRSFTAPLFVSVCWALSLVFFRASNFHDAIAVFGNLGFAGSDALYSFGLVKPEFKFALWLIIGIVIFEILTEKFGEKLKIWFVKDKNTVIRWFVYLLLIFSIIYLGAYGAANDNTFIYFQF